MLVVSASAARTTLKNSQLIRQLPDESQVIYGTGHEQTFLVEKRDSSGDNSSAGCSAYKKQGYKTGAMSLTLPTQYELSYPITLFRWSSHPDTIVERPAARLQHLATGRLVRHSTAGPKPRNRSSVEKLAWHPRAKHENSGANQNAEAAQQHVGQRRQQEHGRRAKTLR
jgi:hypothetical protein